MLTWFAIAYYVGVQQQWGSTLGFPGEGGLTDMARAMVDKCGAHAATVFLQRVVCLSLSTISCEHVLSSTWPRHRGESMTRCFRAWLQVHQESPDPSNRVRSHSQRTCQIALPADMVRCEIRSLSRKGAGVATRWAALSDMLPRAQRALEDAVVSRPNDG